MLTLVSTISASTIFTDTDFQLGPETTDNTGISMGDTKITN